MLFDKMKASEVTKPDQLPAWCQQSKVSFKHASAWLKRACKACHITPTYYAIESSSGDRFMLYVWNSKRALSFDHHDRAYVEMYL